jgi:transcriptional regulator with XRE-family HTH domain
LSITKSKIFKEEVTILKILLLRMRAGLTQQEVANRLDVNPSTITHWEKGRNFPAVSRLPKLAELYGCTVDELLECKKEKEGL